MKYIKLYENFQDNNLDEAAIIDNVYTILFEESESDELSPMERAIKAKGQQWLEDPQYAAAYLRALGMIDDNRDKYIDNIINVDDDSKNIKDFCEPDGKYSDAGIADAVGFKSDTTFGRCVSKMKNMINGVGGTHGEVIFPKIEDAFKKFQEMDVNQVGQIAGQMLQPSTNTAARDSAEAKLLAASGHRADRKSRDTEIGRQTAQMFNSLKTVFPGKSREQLVDQALGKVAGEFKVTAIQAKNALEKYLKDNDVQLIK